MNRKRSSKADPADPGKPATVAGGAKFSFGSRRYASHGPRRLFLPQELPGTVAFENASPVQGGIIRPSRNLA